MYRNLLPNDREYRPVQSDACIHAPCNVFLGRHMHCLDLIPLYHVLDLQIPFLIKSPVDLSSD